LTGKRDLSSERICGVRFRLSAFTIQLLISEIGRFSRLLMISARHCQMGTYKNRRTGSEMQASIRKRRLRSGTDNGGTLLGEDLRPFGFLLLRLRLARMTGLFPSAPHKISSTIAWMNKKKNYIR
jgi:hypothetical protein